MEYKMNIAGLDRGLPLCKVTDDLYIGAFVIFGDPELTTACAKALLEKAPEYDYLITAEAKSIPLIHEMARLNGNQRYILARKYPKLYMRDILTAKVRSITTDKEQTLYMDSLEGEQLRGKKVVILDDVISTGESLAAVNKLVEQFDAEVVAQAAILAEGDAAKRDDIVFLEELPLFFH